MPAGSTVTPAAPIMCETSTSTTNTTTEGANNAKNTSAGSVERRCENPECNVVKLVSMVPKRKTAQFITQPSVMEKPMLVNGFTTIFQVDGVSAKLSDLKHKSAEQTPRTIFRIMPNTHAHIVNYVVVDAGGESMRKINECEPATMRKLLDSQRVSAEQMLKKLMSSHGTPAHIAQTNASAATNEKTGTPGTAAKISAKLITPLPKFVPAIPAAPTVPAAPVVQAPIAITTMTPAIKATETEAPKSTAIQMPLRLHPSLKITPIPGNSAAAATTVTSLSKSAATPLIKAVPLSQLQRKAIVVKRTAAVVDTQPAEASPEQVAPDNDKTQFEKMQQELLELRRTVAILAEAQAKTNVDTTLPVSEDVQLTKRPRLT